MQSLTITSPDDFHLHLRDGHVLSTVAPLSAAFFRRALIMPNLVPPVRTLSAALAYRHRILATLPTGNPFNPLMTVYLTDTTTAADIHAAAASPHVVACKLYPAGATTNSDSGVTSLALLAPALSAMQETGLVLCVHGEVPLTSTGAEVDIFDRESLFLSTVLPTILSTYPSLKIVLEHITTAEAASLVSSTPGDRLAASITAHHLLYSRQDLFASARLHPHYFCLPVLKRQSHREALLAAVASDSSQKFFAGTDSAPHRASSKHTAACCAGAFTASCAIELYAEAFDEAAALPKLDAFLSANGAAFYGLSRNTGSLKLVKAPSGAAPVPASIPVLDKDGGDDGDPIIPLRAGQALAWQIVSEIA